MESGETATVRKIVEALDQMEPDHAKFVAAFAYILSRVAHADLEVTTAETRGMERIMQEHAGLTSEEAILVVQMAKTQNLLFGGTENFLVTREFERLASHEQKLALLECLFAVSSADESISSLEDDEIRRIAGELKLENRDILEARAAYRSFLAVLKREDQARPSSN
jgi:uncharacterized tellurite resistance protein B-like protein